MYALANTTVSILRGTSSDSFGDVVDTPVAIYTGIIAFISYPAMGILRPLVLGSEVFEPATTAPTVTRLAVCSLPSGTDIVATDQVLDEQSQLVYEIYEVTRLGRAGAVLDIVVTLKRITTSETI